jgi:hypothetical protein
VIEIYRDLHLGDQSDCMAGCEELTPNGGKKDLQKGQEGTSVVPAPSCKWKITLGLPA